MITEPRIDKTLEAIRNQLAQVVAPSVTDQSAATTLQFSILLLGDLMNRQRHERSWLEDEIAAVERVVTKAIKDFEDSEDSDTSEPSPLRDAYAGYRRQVDAGAPEVAVHVRYARAGRLLDDVVDAAFLSSNEELIATLQELLFARLQREAELIGTTFEWVGRH